MGRHRETLQWYGLLVGFCQRWGNVRQGVWPTVWVDPSQAMVSTVEEVVRQFTALVSSGPNWPYALVQLNEDTHHVPLPREGHLDILTEGDTNSTTCNWIYQLEVYQLLSSGPQVIYPVGLNGHETPMVVLPPESLAKGTTLIGSEPTYLKVSILQPTPEGQEPKAPPHSGHFSPTQAPSPIKVPPPKVERVVSMTMEVRELLSRAVLDTSGHVSGNSTPKRLNPMVVLMSLPPQIGRSFWSSGHIFPGEHPRWGWDAESHPRVNPHCPLTRTQDSRAQ